MNRLSGTRFQLCAALAAALALAAVPAAQAALEKAPSAVAQQSEAADDSAMEYSELLTAIERGTIVKAEVDDARSRMRVTLDSGDVREVTYPVGADRLIDRLAASGARVELERSGQGIGVLMLLPPILMLLIGGLFLTLFLQQRRGALGKSRQGALRKTEVTDDRPPVRFDDVAGCEEAVEELREMLTFLRTPERFARVGARMPSAVLLHGPPGTGKTLLARALAGEAGVPFFAASGSDFIELYVGVGAKRVRELFTRAKTHEAGAVVFIDEIDAIGKRRGSGHGQTNDERDQTLNALLVELDGFGTSSKVVVVAATNMLDTLDPALLRPGRFGRQITVDLPDETGRSAILEVHATGKPIADGVSLDRIARTTAGLSGAQLAEVVNEAAIMAARSDRAEIVQVDFDEAQLRVLMGPEKRSSMLAEGELEIVSYHEAGHVLAAELCPNHDKAQRATVRPRGRAAGLALYGRTDRALHDAAYVHEQMVCALGGRAAEQIVFGKVSSGAANDLAVVNGIARRAVEELGFSPRLGQIVSSAHGQPMHLSQETLAIIDREVERVVADAYRDALSLLGGHRDALERLAQLLLSQGDVERVDIVTALGHELDPAELAPVMGTRQMHPQTDEPVAPRVVVPFAPKRRGIVQRLAAAIVERGPAEAH